jgi:hypothetical protein
MGNFYKIFGDGFWGSFIDILWGFTLWMWNTSKIVGDSFWVHLQTSFVDFGIK